VRGRERAKRGDEYICALCVGQREQEEVMNISLRACVGEIERGKRGDEYICACVRGRDRESK